MNAFCGVFARNDVYKDVKGWEQFEPWMGRIEAMQPETVYELADELPPDWYGGDRDALEKLIEKLIARRNKVAGLIDEFRKSSRQPFPNWKERVQ